MLAKIYYQSNKEHYKQIAKDYYKNNKDLILERLKNKDNNLSKEDKGDIDIYAKNWYNNLPEDKKNIKIKYGRNRYHGMSNEQMQKHKEYQKKYQK